MTVLGENPTILQDPRLLPGGERIVRHIDGVGEIIFENYAAGQWLTQKGDPAKRSRRRYLLNGDEVESVSQLADCLRKAGLEAWKEWIGASGALRAERLGELRDVDPDDGKQIVARVRLLGLDAQTRADEAADRGTAIHAVFDSLSRGEPAPNPADFPGVVRPWLRGAMRAWRQLGLTDVLAAEQIVAHPELKYAGRLDLIGFRGGKATLLDYKTSAKGRVYPQAHFTTRLYAMAARECGLQVDDIVIVGIGDDGQVDPVSCDVSVLEAAAMVTVARAFARVDRDAAARARRAAKAAA